MGSRWEATTAAGNAFKWNRAASAGGSSTFCISLCTVVFIWKINYEIHLCKFIQNELQTVLHFFVVVVSSMRSSPEWVTNPSSVPQCGLGHLAFRLTNRCRGRAAGPAREVPHDHTCANTKTHKSSLWTQLWFMWILLLLSSSDVWENLQAR